MQMEAVAQHASDLGMELIPAIQVLGHLEQLLHWPAYSHVRDTPNVLLASDDDRAFQLLVRRPSELSSSRSALRRRVVGSPDSHGERRGRSMVQERMLESVITATGAKRVHLGLDETFGLGQGKYRSSRCKRVTPHECEHPPQASTIFQTHVRRMLVR